MCMLTSNLRFIIKVSPGIFTRHMQTLEVFKLFLQFLRVVVFRF